MKVFLSMSSIPQRITQLEPILQSILNQDFKDFNIICNVPNEYTLRTKNSPIIPRFLNNDKIIINRCSDLGPATKLLPSLSLIEDDDIIVTFDDDTFYPPSWLSKLIDTSNKYPNSCVGYRGKCFSSNPLEYMTCDESIDPEYPKRVDLLTGVWGVLYKKFFFNDSVFDYSNAPRECLFNDDIWFCGHLAKKEIQRLMILNDIGIDSRTPIGSLSALHLNENRSNKNNNIILKYFEDSFIKTSVLGL